MKRLLSKLLVCFMVLLAAPALAQDVQNQSNDEQKSWLTSFVQDRLSTPERQIALSNIDGILGSDVSIREITISDQQGVWLRVNNARLTWNQAALFLGRLDVSVLRADSIEYLRNAVPSDAVDLPSPEAGGFSIPSLPVAVNIGDLEIPSVSFGEDVFGLGSLISIAGNLTLENGNLATKLDIVRLDGPGGTLGLNVAYTKDTNNFDVNFALNEPENGVLANLLSIEGRPAISLTIIGQGPVDNLRTDLTLTAAGQTALAGATTIKRSAAGFDVATDLRGPISRLIAEPYRAFFGPETALTANALVKDGGGLSISALKLGGGQLSLDATAETTADNFLRQLAVNASIVDASGAKVRLPVAGSATLVDAAKIAIDFGRADSEDWNSDISIAGLQTSGFAAQSIALTLNGVAANLETPAERRVTFNGDGAVSGIVASDEIEAALGDSIGLGIAGKWNAGQPIDLAQFRIVGDALTLALSGNIADLVFNGDVAIQTSNIAPFSGLAGRDVSGALDLAAKGTISPLSAGFNLTLDGTGSNLTVSDELADGLLAGDVRLTGRVARTEQGIEAQDFRIANNQVQLGANGNFASTTADFTFNLDLANLALLSDQASGPLRVVGTANGTEGVIALDLNANVAAGSLARKTLRDAAFGFAGTLVGTNLTGNLTGDAFLDGFRVALAAGVTSNELGRNLSGLNFEAGGSRVTGDLLQRPDGLLEGKLNLASADVSVAAALALVQASGAVNADVVLTAVDGNQNAVVNGSVRNLKASDVTVGSADVAANIADLFGVPAIQGKINGSQISAAGVDVATLAVTANQTGNTTAFAGTANLLNGTNIDLAGSLEPLDGGYRLGLDRAALTQGQLSARLANPATVSVSGSNLTFNGVQFDIGSGRITATGSAGEALNIALDIRAVPLSIANAIAPDLGLAGTLNGTAQVSGSGSNPRVQFSAEAAGINAAAIREFGIAPLSLSTNGTFADGIVSIASLRANGTGGLTLTASGNVPLARNGLSLTVNGSAPLSLANRFVADRGGQLTGAVTLDARATGSISAPQFGGTISTSNAGYIDPELNARLQNISGSATLSGTTATINNLSASLATGGSVNVSGTIGLAAGFPANLALRLNSARYADGNLFVATVSGGLTLTGPLARNPLLAGTVLVEKANISVPETFGGSADLIDVKHIAPSRAVAQTLARADIDKSGAPTPASRSVGLLLDVNLNAPNQIFVRGRGLDAEVGGSVRLTGPINDIQPVGGFELVRGRLSILGQRVTFETGTVTLVGDLDPFLNFVARTEGDGITVFVTLNGRASELDVTFTSNPVLPQDEVLSRLIFRRSLTELSPLQLARLAGAAAELAGGSNSSLIDSLRASTGLDDLDIVTDAQGNVAVQAGQYIQENVYLGVQAGANGDSRVSVNLDITDDLKARASAGVDGNSDVGVFFEKDY